MTSDTSVGRRLGATSGRLLLVVLVVGLTGVLIGGLFMPTAMAVEDVIGIVRNDVFDIPPLPEEFDIPPERSTIYAADGSELETIFFQEQRVSVPLDDIPVNVREAVIATEDADFYSHRGINHTAIVRAALTNIRAGGIESGASTITQQYVKGVVLTADQSIERKIKEALYAVELEKRLTKDEILERYLNRTYFGDGVYGVKTAAEHYFSKSLNDLSLGEAAVLAGVIRSPEKNNPVADSENAINRRNIVLDQMANNGFITSDERDRAKREALLVNVKEPEDAESPFFGDWVKRLLISESTAEALGTQVDALQAMGVTPDERIATVFQGGLKIYTTIDPEFQTFAEEALVKHLGDPLRDPLGAIVSVEPGTGKIVTMAVGPKTHGDCNEPVEIDDEGRMLCDKTKFNPAVPADVGSSRVGRQPGSSFKPFIIAAALENGIPPGWQIDATGPQTIPACDNGRNWKVNNSGGNGLRDMYSGVKGSSNVYHARLIAELGPELVPPVAERLGVRSSDIPANCSLSLGAIEVYPLEMATAYATLANLGEYCAPYAIERIEDKQGNVLYEAQPRCERVLDEDIARRVVDIMSGPVTSGGTAPIANLGRWPTRGKTGTTNDYVDAWFVGYVRQLATAAWVGYENGIVTYSCEVNPDKCAQQTTQCFDVSADGLTRGCVERKLMQNVTINGSFQRRVFGGTIPAPMWKSYMARAVNRYEPEGWPGPGSMPGATVPDLLAAANSGEAEKIAKAAGLNFELKLIDDWQPEGTVLSQEPAAGTGVARGNLVILYASNGLGQPPIVPGVIGFNVVDAQAMLSAQGFQPRIVYKDVGDQRQHDIVQNQSPEGGTLLEPGPGAVVVIQIGRFKAEPEPEPEPSETEDRGKPKDKPSDGEGPV